jgi:outer membrane protein
MQNFRFSYLLRALVISSLLGASAAAQTPPQNPSQQDATRPPGTEQRQTVPPESRPVPSDPTAPPGVNRTPPQNPPGVYTNPQTTAPNTPSSQTAPPIVSPNAVTPTTPQIPSGTTLPGESNVVVREPNLPPVQARPVPPMPSLSRLGVQPDNTLPLTLNEAIRRALENNNDIEVARNNVRYAETQLRALEGFYDPVFNFNPQYQSSVTPQTSRFGGSTASGTVTQNDFLYNSTITKPFATGGGNYQLFFNNDRRSTNSTASFFSSNYSSSFGITFTQPLLRDRSIDNQRRQIRIQKKRVAQTDADFRQSTIQVINNVQRAYWDLVFALRDQQNYVSNVNLAREDFRRTEAGIVAGSTAPLQRAEIATELATREASLVIATQNVSIAENALKQLILRDPLAKEWGMAIMPTDEPKFDDTPINLPALIQEARANRPELARQRLQQEMNEIDIQYFKNQTRPRVDLQSTFTLTGLAGTPNPVVINSTVIDPTTGLPFPTNQVPLIFGDPTQNANAFLLAQINQLRALQNLAPATVPFTTSQGVSIPSDLIGGYGQTLRNLFGLGTRNITVGVAIQIPLRNRTAQANLAGAMVQKEQYAAQLRSQEQLIEQDVRNAAQAVETARQRVTYARQARQSAEEQLAGEQKLYAVGRSTTFLLFQREDALVTARDQEIRAETDYNKALADLQRATSTTLRANNVMIESLVQP